MDNISNVTEFHPCDKHAKLELLSPYLRAGPFVYGKCTKSMITKREEVVKIHDEEKALKLFHRSHTKAEFTEKLGAHNLRRFEFRQPFLNLMRTKFCPKISWPAIETFNPEWVQVLLDWDNKLSHERALYIHGPTGIGKSHLVMSYLQWKGYKYAIHVSKNGTKDHVEGDIQVHVFDDTCMREFTDKEIHAYVSCSAIGNLQVTFGHTVLHPGSKRIFIANTPPDEHFQRFKKYRSKKDWDATERRLTIIPLYNTDKLTLVDIEDKKKVMFLRPEGRATSRKEMHEIVKKAKEARDAVDSGLENISPILVAGPSRPDGKREQRSPVAGPSRPDVTREQRSPVAGPSRPPPERVEAASKRNLMFNPDFNPLESSSPKKRSRRRASDEVIRRAFHRMAQDTEENFKQMEAEARAAKSKYTEEERRKIDEKEAATNQLKVIQQVYEKKKTEEEEKLEREQSEKRFAQFEESERLELEIQKEKTEQLRLTRQKNYKVLKDDMSNMKQINVELFNMFPANTRKGKKLREAMKSRKIDVVPSENVILETVIVLPDQNESLVTGNQETTVTCNERHNGVQDKNDEDDKDCELERNMTKLTTRRTMTNTKLKKLKKAKWKREYDDENAIEDDEDNGFQCAQTCKLRKPQIMQIDEPTSGRINPFTSGRFSPSSCERIYPSTSSTIRNTELSPEIYRIFTDELSSDVNLSVNSDDRCAQRCKRNPL